MGCTLHQNLEWTKGRREQLLDGSSAWPAACPQLQDVKHSSDVGIKRGGKKVVGSEYLNTETSPTLAQISTVMREISGRTLSEPPLIVEEKLSNGTLSH